MARFNIFSRLSNLITGFFSIFIADIEKANPEIAYETALASMAEKYGRLKNATAAIIARRKDIEVRLDRSITIRDKAEQNLHGALNLGDADLGAVCIQTIDEKNSEIDELQKELSGATEDCNDAKSGLQEIQQEIRKLQAEKHRMIAKLESAEARNQIHEQLEGISVDAEIKALDTVRQHIKNTAAKADLNREMSETDLEVKLKKLSQNSAAISAKAKFAQLKKEQEKNEKVTQELEELVERTNARSR